MKNYYKKTILTIEELEKIDVLLDSNQTDNMHVDSQDIIDHEFSLEKLL